MKRNYSFRKRSYKMTLEACEAVIPEALTVNTLYHSTKHKDVTSLWQSRSTLHFLVTCFVTVHRTNTDEHWRTWTSTDEHWRTRTNTDEHGRTLTNIDEHWRTCRSYFPCFLNMRIPFPNYNKAEFNYLKNEFNKYPKLHNYNLGWDQLRF